MFGRQSITDKAVNNLAKLIVLSAKDRMLTIELKEEKPIGKLDDGSDADVIINDAMKTFGEYCHVKDGELVPHINGTPIPKRIFADVMKCIGEVYMNDHNNLAIKEL